LEFPIHLNEIAYHITNVCNLSCTHCISYSNIKGFSGYSKWEDHFSKNKLWPNFINPHKVQITGGETFLNPDLINWVRGIRNLWPDKYVSVLTNGTLFHKSNVKKITKEILNLGFEIEISIHHENHYLPAYESFLNILKESNINHSEEYTIFAKNSSKKIVEDLRKFRNKDTNKVLGTIERKQIFFQNSIKFYDKNLIKMHDNDPIKTHENCCLKTCGIIVDGDLFKCVAVAVGKQLNKQFNVLNKHNMLLNDYVPCSPIIGKNKVYDFLKNINEPIKQCGLCDIGFVKVYNPIN